MKVLLIHQFFLRKDQGGGQRFNEFVKTWADQGIQVDVIAGSGHYLSENERASGLVDVEDYYDNVKVWRCSVSNFYHKGVWGRLLGYLSYFLSSLFVLLFKAGKSYDVIIATSPPLTIMFTGIIAKFLKSGKLVFEVRDLWPDAAVDLGVIKSKTVIHILKSLEKWFYKKADYINVLSPDFKTYLIDRYNISASKIWFVPNGGQKGVMVDPKITTNKDFVLVYAGAMSLANNVSELLDLAAATLEYDIKYMLVGEGTEKEALQKRVVEEGLDHVSFLPLLSYPEVLDLIKKADVGVVTYRWGDVLNMNYTNKMFDYLSCGIPVILTLPGASKQFVEKKECGRWVEPGNVDDWKRVILDLKEDLILCNQLGMNGYSLIDTEFNREKLAVKYLELMLKIVNKE